MLTLPLSSAFPKRSGLAAPATWPGQLLQRLRAARRHRDPNDQLAGSRGYHLGSFSDHQLRNMGLHRIPDTRTSIYTPSGHGTLLGFSLTSSF